MAKDPLPVGRGVAEADDEDGRGVDFDAVEIDLLMPVLSDAVMDTDGVTDGVGVLDTAGVVDSAPEVAVRSRLFLA